METVKETKFEVENSEYGIKQINQILEWVPVNYACPSNDENSEMEWGNYTCCFDGRISNDWYYISGIELLKEILDGYCCGGCEIGTVEIYTSDGYKQASNEDLLDIGRAYDVWVEYNSYHAYDSEYCDLFVHFTTRRDYPAGGLYWLKSKFLTGPKKDENKENKED